MEAPRSIRYLSSYLSICFFSSLLGVSVEDLLLVETEKTTSRKAAKIEGSNGRPVGKVREVFDRVSKLPRREQEHIVNWVSAYVSKYEQTRQG